MPVNDSVLEWTYVVEAGKAREFARAVFDDDGGRSGLAPPTLLIHALAASVDHFVDNVARLDKGRTVHGEEEFTFERPVRAGDVLRCVSRVVEDYTKEGRRGGSMRFVVFETEMRDAANGELVARERMTSIEMSKASGS